MRGGLMSRNVEEDCMGEDVRIEFWDCTETMLREIAHPSIRQKHVAQSYALAIRSSYPTDWAVINRAIIARWSVSGLERIKNLAWSGKAFNGIR
jgi:hypothetical protein